MPCHRTTPSHAYFQITYSTLALALVGACSSTTPSSPTDSGSGPDSTASDAGGGDSGRELPATMCASPGMPTPGPADTHCKNPEGGADTMQPVDPASCHVPVPDGAAPQACPYGDTIYGMDSNDDDCKYHVTWSSSPICESDGGSGVVFKFVVTVNGTTTPVTGPGMFYAEVFTTSPADAGCDDVSTHPGPNNGVALVEGPPGTFTAPIQFDQPGQWTVRLHLHAECSDALPTSQHGHAAYHITVP